MSFIKMDSARLQVLALAAVNNINAEYTHDMRVLEDKYVNVKAVYDAALEKSKKHWWSALPTYPDDLVELRRNKGWHLKMLNTRLEVPKRILVATSLVNEVNIDVKDLQMIKSWADNA